MITITDSKRTKQSDADLLPPESASPMDVVDLGSMRAQYTKKTERPPFAALAEDYDHQQSLQYLRSLEETSTGVMTEFKNNKTINDGATLEKESKNSYSTSRKTPPNIDVQGFSSSEGDLYGSFNVRHRLFQPVLHCLKQNGLKTNGRPVQHSSQLCAGAMHTKNASVHVGNFFDLHGDYDLTQTQNLAETMSQPLVCLICSVFCTDSPEVLIEHAERSRIPLDLEAANRQVTTHSEGMWHCRVCAYRSALKANFQLHCKTEKHAQRLNLLVHIWEGVPPNTQDLTGVLCIQEARAADISSAFTKCLQIISTSGSTSSSSISSSSSTITTPSSSSTSASSVPCQASAFVQLRCLACGFFSGSVHKFRVHCQMLSHVRFTRLFSLITHKRNELRASLDSFIQTYADHMKTVPTLPVVCTARNASEPKAVTTVNSAVMQNLFKMMANFKVVYACRPCLQEAPAEANKNYHWFSVTEALRHCQSEEHQCHLQTFEGSLTSPLYVEEVEILWELAGKRGTADQLPAVIARFLMESTDTTENTDASSNDPQVSVTNERNTKLDPPTGADSAFVVSGGVDSVSGGEERLNDAVAGGPTHTARETEGADMVIRKSGLQLWQLQEAECFEGYSTENEGISPSKFHFPQPAENKDVSMDHSCTDNYCVKDHNPEDHPQKK
nr:unnamed protein product [Spirometra erinaceieuropaei]